MVLHNYGGISNNEGGVGEEGGSARDTVGGDGCDDRDGEWRKTLRSR